jgi:hypothetical protein
MLDKVPSSTPRPAETHKAPRVEKKPEPAPATKAEPAQATPPAHSTGSRGGTSQLEHPSSKTASNPAASAEITSRQSHTAARISGKGDGNGSAFDRIAHEEGHDGLLSRLTHGVDDLTQDATAGAGQFLKGAAHTVDQAADRARAGAEKARQQARDEAIKPAPEGFAAGDTMASAPDLSKRKPLRVEKLEHGRVRQTFEVDGQKYHRTSDENGNTTTTFESGGIAHRETQYSDGRSVQQIQKGAPQQSAEVVGMAALEAKSGQPADQYTRTVVRDPKGRVARDSYSYEGARGSMGRVTEHKADGTSRTRIDRTYSVDRPLEALASAPPAPSNDSGVVVLPSGAGKPTQVHESEVSAIGSNGERQVQSRQTSFTQSSNALSNAGQERPPSSGSEISHTVTTSQTRGKDGKMASRTAASQSISLSNDDGSRTVQTDSWNDRGESSQQYLRTGLTSDDLDGIEDGAEAREKAARGESPSSEHAITVAGKTVAIGPPGGSDGLKREKSGDWLEEASHDGNSFDLNVTVRRDAQGDMVDKTSTFSSLDDNGNGRTVTRTRSNDPDAQARGSVQWSYTRLSNDGRDYDRQTAYENSSVSTYEKHRELGPGQFEHSTETKDGDNVIARSSSGRVEVRDLSQVENRLKPEALARLKAGGPPYILEETSAQAKLWRDGDGEIQRDKEGRPLQQEGASSTLMVTGPKGVAASEMMSDIVHAGTGRRDRSSLSSLSDPSGHPPYQAQFEKGHTPSGSCDDIVDQRQNVSIGRDGQIMVDGKEAARIPGLGENGFARRLRQNPSAGVEVLDTLSSASESTGYADSAAKAGKQAIDHHYNKLGFDAPDGARLSKLSGAAGILGLASGASDIFSGIRQGGVDGYTTALGGAGGIAGGLEGGALAASALPGKAGAEASRLAGAIGAGTAAKFLGHASGVASVLVGAEGLITGDSTAERISGGLTAASGGLFIAAAASSGTIVGAPAGVVLAGAGVVAGGAGLALDLFGGDDEPDSLAPDLDSRLERN